jgi:hypothetical protein
VYGGRFVQSSAHHHSCFVCLEPSITFSGFVKGDRLTVLAHFPLARELLKRTNCGYCFPFAKLLNTNKSSTQIPTGLMVICGSKDPAYAVSLRYALL